MKAKLTALRTMFIGLGFDTASNWNAERCGVKLKKLSKIIDDKSEVDPAVIEDKKSRALFDELKTAYSKDEEVTVIDDTAEEGSEEKPKADADEKPAKSEKKAAKEEKPASKDEESDDDDDTKEQESKKTKAPKAAKKDSTVEKNAFGSRVGSDNAKVDAVLSKEPQTIGELAKAAKIDRVRYAHLNELVEGGFAKKVEKDGKAAWTLGKKSAK